MIYLPCKDINEANSILVLIGKCPYENVAELMERLKAAVQAQAERPHVLRAEDG